MSNQTYGLYAPAAFLVDPEASAYIILSSRRKRSSVPKSVKDLLKSGQFRDLARTGQLPEDFSDPSAAKDELDNLDVENIYCSEFEGSATSCFQKTPKRLSVSTMRMIIWSTFHAVGSLASFMPPTKIRRSS